MCLLSRFMRLGLRRWGYPGSEARLCLPLWLMAIQSLPDLLLTPRYNITDLKCSTEVNILSFQFYKVLTIKIARLTVISRSFKSFFLVSTVYETREFMNNLFPCAPSDHWHHYGQVVKSMLFPGSLLQHRRPSLLHESLQHLRPLFLYICVATHTVNSLEIPWFCNRSVITYVKICPDRVHGNRLTVRPNTSTKLKISNSSNGVDYIYLLREVHISHVFVSSCRVISVCISFGRRRRGHDVMLCLTACFSAPQS